MLPAELTVLSLAELEDKLNGVNVVADCMVKDISRLDVLMGRMQRPVLQPGGAGCVSELGVFWPTHQSSSGGLLMRVKGQIQEVTLDPCISGLWYVVCK